MNVRRKQAASALSRTPRIASLSLALAMICTSLCASARDGDLDLGFGTDGKVFVDYAGFQSIEGLLVEVARQPGGELLVVSSPHFSGPDYDFGILRLLPDGSVDSTFGISGHSFHAFDRPGSDLGDHVNAIAVLADGSIILGGYANGDASTGADMAFVKLLGNGVIDGNFGAAGATIVPFNLGDCSTGHCADQATRINLQTDGKILVAGAASTNDGVIMAVARLTTTGQRDTSFDVDGRVTLQFGTGNASQAFRAKQLADGAHIVVVGAADMAPGSSNQDFVAARLNANGSLDPTFGVDGKLSYAFDIGGNLVDTATDFVELSDGKLLLCGQVQVNGPGNFDFGCMRFLANGVPDPAFAPLLIPFDAGGDLSDVPMRIEQDTQGRLVLVGATSVSQDNYNFAVARLTAAGTLDATFGVGGVKTFDSLPGTDMTERSNAATGIAFDPDGKIIVAGYTVTNSADDRKFELVRLIGDTISENGFD